MPKKRNSKPLHIAFDARELKGEPQGMGVYLQHIAQELVDRKVRITLLTDGPLSWHPVGPARYWKVIVKPGVEFSTRRFTRIFWQENVLPQLLKRVRPDVYHAIANQAVPPECPVPSVLTIHDLIPLVLPMNQEHYYAYQFACGVSIARADRIVTISRWTSHDLYRLYPIARGKTTMIYNGVDRLRPEGSNPFAKYSPYIAYNGGFGYRKNVDTLLRGFAKVIKEPGFRDFKMVLIGGKSGSYDEFRKVTKQLKLEDRTIFPGYVDSAQIGPILRDAFCMVLPTKYEGFGLPPLEAMSVGCPVIVAKNTSLPEVVGKAGLFVPTMSADAIARQLKRLQAQPELRQELISAGYRNLRRFSWKKTVDGPMNVYQDSITVG